MTQDAKMQVCQLGCDAFSRLKLAPFGIPKCQPHYKMLFYTFWGISLHTASARSFEAEANPESTLNDSSM